MGRSRPICAAVSQRAEPMEMMSQPLAPLIRCALMPAQPPWRSFLMVAPILAASASSASTSASSTRPPKPATVTCVCPTPAEAVDAGEHLPQQLVLRRRGNGHVEALVGLDQLAELALVDEAADVGEAFAHQLDVGVLRAHRREAHDLHFARQASLEHLAHL